MLAPFLELERRFVFWPLLDRKTSVGFILSRIGRGDVGLAPSKSERGALGLDSSRVRRGGVDFVRLGTGDEIGAQTQYGVREEVWNWP